MRHAVATTFIVVLLLTAAPVHPAKEVTDTAGASREEQLEEIRRLKKTLDDAREALAALEELLRRAEAGEPWDTAETDLEQLRLAASELRSEFIEGSDILNAALADFVNAAPPIAGQPMPPAIAEALRIKTEEDLDFAQEYINKGGDYDRAIRIYEQVLAYDPDNPEVLAALERARELRYVDAERFARVEVGMTKAEVREALGPVNLRNTRTYEDLGVEAWYYLKGLHGRPAVVYFWERGGRWEVYRAEFDAGPSDR